MSIIHLRKKCPEHQSQSSLRLAVRKMQVALDKQRIDVAEYRGSLSKLRNVMQDMKCSFQELDSNLEKIQIKSLRRNSLKLAQIMDRAAS